MKKFFIIFFIFVIIIFILFKVGIFDKFFVINNDEQYKYEIDSLNKEYCLLSNKYDSIYNEFLIKDSLSKIEKIKYIKINRYYDQKIKDITNFNTDYQIRFLSNWLSTKDSIE